MRTIRTELLRNKRRELFFSGYSIIIHVVNISKLLNFQSFVAKQWLLRQKDPSYPAPSPQLRMDNSAPLFNADTI
jgi:hypothetical protein